MDGNCTKTSRHGRSLCCGHREVSWGNCLTSHSFNACWPCQIVQALIRLVSQKDKLWDNLHKSIFAGLLVASHDEVPWSKCAPKVKVWGQSAQQGRCFINPCGFCNPIQWELVIRNAASAGETHKAAGKMTVTEVANHLCLFTAKISHCFRLLFRASLQVLPTKGPAWMELWSWLVENDFGQRLCPKSSTSHDHTWSLTHSMSTMPFTAQVYHLQLYKPFSLASSYTSIDAINATTLALLRHGIIRVWSQYTGNEETKPTILFSLSKGF